MLFTRYIQYNPTSLERNHNHELLTEVDLGVPIDLVLPETYTNPDPTGTLTVCGVGGCGCVSVCVCV